MPNLIAAVGLVVRDYKEMIPYGIVAGFFHLYGNRWGLVGPRSADVSVPSSGTDAPTPCPPQDNNLLGLGKRG